MVESRKPAFNRHISTASGYHSHLENEIQLDGWVVLQFDCHLERAFFALRRIWASRAMCRVFCDTIKSAFGSLPCQTAPLQDSCELKLLAPSAQARSRSPAPASIWLTGLITIFQARLLIPRHYPLGEKACLARSTLS
jgi:hypothetical protein